MVDALAAAMNIHTKGKKKKTKQKQNLSFISLLVLRSTHVLCRVSLKSDCVDH